MKSKLSLKKKIGIVAVVILLTLSSGLLFASPLYACPGGGDISVAAMYKAMNNAIDNLWDGRMPKRSDIEIISKLPTCGAKHAAQCIVGVPEGETPPEWKSDKPGRFEMIPVEGTDAKNLRLAGRQTQIYLPMSILNA
jgi:hypothetical protein